MSPKHIVAIIIKTTHEILGLDCFKDSNKSLITEHPGAVGKFFDHPAGWVLFFQQLRHAAYWFARNDYNRELQGSIFFVPVIIRLPEFPGETQ